MVKDARQNIIAGTFDDFYQSFYKRYSSKKWQGKPK
jgi:UDP-galactopyranose mutase